jgi:hypothetical protein
MRMRIMTRTNERMTVRTVDKSIRGGCSVCVFSSPPWLMVGKAKMGPLAVGRGVRVGTGVGVVMRGVARNASLVGVEDEILRGVGVRVAVGVRDGLKKKGVREAVG